MSWERIETGLRVYAGELPVRGGSYGDPAAVPFEVWEALFSKAKNWTAYTHHWRTCDQRLKKYAMASVDSPEERDEAQALGWRTFMVVPEETQPVVQLEKVSYYPGFRTTGVAHRQVVPNDHDILCPATDPHPKRNATCATCLLCRGTSAKAPSIWEVAHGRNKENHKW